MRLVSEPPALSQSPSTTSSPRLPRILCVDDEARVLEGLVLVLRPHFDVYTALGSEKAMQKLQEIHGAAVVIADMRMPQMSGAQLLHQVQEHWPETIRILLTGDSGRDTAVDAINQAHVFRLLTKPCPQQTLIAAVNAGVAQFRVQNAERAMLQETVLGCIDALVDVLAISNPVAFGRAHRVKRLAIEFARCAGFEDFWQLEAAATLSQIGYISLSPRLCEKLYRAEQLTEDEQALAERAPGIATKLLDHIPRLEPVMQILTALQWSDEQIMRLGYGTIGMGTRILAMALDYDMLLSADASIDKALSKMQLKQKRFGASLLKQFSDYANSGTGKAEATLLTLGQLAAGMIILQELRTDEGALLAPHGLQVGPAFLERVSTLGPETLSRTLRVLIPPHLTVLDRS